MQWGWMPRFQHQELVLTKPKPLVAAVTAKELQDMLATQLCMRRCKLDNCHGLL